MEHLNRVFVFAFKHKYDQSLTDADQLVFATLYHIYVVYNFWGKIVWFSTFLAVSSDVLDLTCSWGLIWF